MSTNKVLVAFESKYGQGEKIAAFLREVASRRGLDADVVRARAPGNLDVTRYDAVIVIAPIYFGRHPRSIARLLRAHADACSMRPLAFVSVSNSAASGEPAVRAEASRIATAFMASIPIRADMIVTAGGALAYPRYGWLLRLVMKRIARRSGGPQDTSRVHELTDWSSLEATFARFLDSVADLTSPRRAAGEPVVGGAITSNSART